VAGGWRAQIAMSTPAREIGVYIHIPYCKTLCPYCDFVKERTSALVPDAFTAGLISEIQNFGGPTDCISVFLGGGTPSLLPPQSLEKILDALRGKFSFCDAEITIEANPDDISLELAQAWRSMGVNRVSMGVQSFDDRVLRYLGRRHNADVARNAIGIIKDTFENWNMDLIFGAPPIGAWAETLRETLEFDPPHVAAYGLTYEAGTPFERKKSEALDSDDSLLMYRQLEEALGGYEHYEISNFAKTRRESRHNLIYWHNAEYAGFGTGAYSYIGGLRGRNHTTTDTYLKAPGEKCEALALTLEEQRVETIIQYLRLRSGMPKAAYTARFGADVRAHYGEALDALITRGLLEENETRIRPTKEGFYLNNEIGLALVGG